MYRIPSIDFCVHLFPSPSGCGEIRTGRVVSVPSYEFYSGVGSYPFSASKPSTIVCRARNEPTQRRIKPGSSQPTVPLPTNCPLSLVCVYVSVRVCVCEGDQRTCSYQISPPRFSLSPPLFTRCVCDVMSTCRLSNQIVSVCAGSATLRAHENKQVGVRRFGINCQ